MKTKLFLLSALLVLGACATYIPSEVKNTISSYEAICLGKAKTVKYNGLAMKVVL